MFEGSLPSCWPHSAGCARTFAPVANKLARSSENATQNLDPKSDDYINLGSLKISGKIAVMCALVWLQKGWKATDKERPKERTIHIYAVESASGPKFGCF